MKRPDQKTGGNPAASESRQYHELAKARIAGGVNSNVRLSGAPMCFVSGKGSHLTDVDGNVYIDYALGMGPTILGHAPAAVIAEVSRTLALGQLFAGQHTLELEVANEFCACIRSAELVRFGLSGSEMVQAAIRVARAFTGRPEVIKFEGHYHGWFDNILINLNPPVAAGGNPIPRPRHLQSGGQSPHASDDIAVLPWNDVGAIDQYIGANASRIAAIITEPIMFNTGGILPKPGYLEHLRQVTSKHNIVLIFDEVITGFRVALGGAQEIYNIQPDLSVFAKAFGAGFPVAALAGRRAIMEMFASGGVNHSGTYNANLVSLSAALASLRELTANDQAAFKRINSTGKALMDGIAAAGRKYGAELQVSGMPAAFHTCFPRGPIHDYATYTTADQKKLGRFLTALLESGVRPTSRGTWFVSAAHTDEDVASTLNAVERALQRIG
ncbi:MAG: aminotransferase class III-fold pyridoxal phosphate-dependent enzyme [Proteobacteria bacterium]|nr:aminotransferase class III-fold pyridoxal phosphate-dependent enzyme [Pseudomonadota bacterium]